MKKFWLFILSLFAIFLVWNISQANSEYEYTNLDISANILNDGTINVGENFTANFFVYKHWIIRDIPLNYSVGWKDFHIDISNINVQWKNFTTSKNNWNVEIKIWDANKTIIWEQNYPISYSVYGLIKNFSWMWYAELYWNLVGYDFDTNINKVRAEIILPKTYTWFTKNDFLITTDWESKTIDWFEWTVDWSKWDKIIITYDKKLSAKNGITLAIKFPNSYFEFDHDRQSKLSWHILAWNSESDSIWPFITILMFLFSPIILIILSAYYIIKFVRNKWMWIKKEFREKYPVIIQYDPPKWLNSAEVWILLHRYSNPKDTFSLVYKWAYEWFIKIQSWQGNSDFSLVKIKDIPWDYPEYEKELFNDLFVENEALRC